LRPWPWRRQLPLRRRLSQLPKLSPKVWQELRESAIQAKSAQKMKKTNPPKSLSGFILPMERR
jgi:hypothetical protein